MFTRRISSRRLLFEMCCDVSQRQLTRLIVVTLEHRILNSVYPHTTAPVDLSLDRPVDQGCVVSMSWNNMRVAASSVHQERTSHSLNPNGIEHDGNNNTGLINGGSTG